MSDKCLRLIIVIERKVMAMCTVRMACRCDRALDIEKGTEGKGKKPRDENGRSPYRLTAFVVSAYFVAGTCLAYLAAYLFPLPRLYEAKREGERRPPQRICQFACREVFCSHCAYYEIKLMSQ